MTPRDRQRWVVMKFGGTSVRDADAMRRVVHIVRAELERELAGGGPPRRFPVVVASACAGVTDQLLACARAVGQGERDAAITTLQAIGDHHRRVLADLSPIPEPAVACELDALLDELDRLVDGVSLLEELTPRSTDLFASFGERLSTTLLSHAFSIAGMRAATLDSRRVIITDGRHTEARPLMDEIDLRARAVIGPLADGNDVVVAQGFIGSTLDGVTTTIGRGGSDHSGALLGAGLEAEEIQIWTDVSGILTADPRVVPEARVVRQVTFSEARELATFGAKVLHPDTIAPAVARRIPVVIRNSMRPDDTGTRILPDDTPLPPAIHSVSTRTDLLLIRLTPRRGSEGSGPPRAPQVLAAHDVPMLIYQLVEGNALAVVPRKAFDDVVMADLEETCLVAVRENIALVCLCGVGMDECPEGLADAIDALRGRSIPLAASGPSRHAHLLAIDADNVASAVKALHRRMFTAEPQPG